MASVLRLARNFLRKAPFQPLKFPSSGFEVVPKSFLLEEESHDEFRRNQYYPVNIGDIFSSRYQVVGKLGFGVSSTVWLAQDLQVRKHVALKIYIRGEHVSDEFKFCEKLAKSNAKHPGHPHVRSALDALTITRPDGDHQCLVMKPMWDSFKDLLLRNPTHRFTKPLLKAGLIQIFRALDYLHTQCHVIHTDIKADNILLDIEDKSILDAFTKRELENPSPRKEVDGKPVYLSRRFDRPREYGGAVLSDFGSCVSGDKLHDDDVQPDVYRSPEVMLGVPWTYPIDIWNVGAMIWDLFERKHLFYGKDQERQKYTTRAHLAEVVGILGLPPLELLQRGKRSPEFFTEEGQWKADIKIPEGVSLEKSEEFLEGDDKKLFLNFMRKMLQWMPEDRKTAEELLRDPWLNSPDKPEDY